MHLKTDDFSDLISNLYSIGFRDSIFKVTMESAAVLKHRRLKFTGNVIVTLSTGMKNDCACVPLPNFRVPGASFSFVSSFSQWEVLAQRYTVKFRPCAIIGKVKSDCI